MDIYILMFFFFLIGLCVGSFLNVCIYRLPASKSIVQPSSMCPVCETPIRFYDNIPVLSYTLLGGRCRHCRTAIPFRYPLVELMTGLIALALFFKFGLSVAYPIHFIFLAALVVITFIDLDHQIIPDIITLPGIPVFFLAALALPTISLTDSLLGIVIGGGSLYLVAWSYFALTGKEGMGGGDIKLLAMIGALLGWKGVVFTIFTGSAVGCVAGIGVMMATRKGLKLAIPFGPFLSIGATAYLFWGPALIDWYLGYLQ